MIPKAVIYCNRQSFFEVYEQVSGHLDPESKLPLSLWLLEDPDSPVALPGAACLDLHDCLHILLNRGYTTADEAFVVGFSVASQILMPLLLCSLAILLVAESLGIVTRGCP